jgi:hypothetical protein
MEVILLVEEAEYFSNEGWTPDLPGGPFAPPAVIDLRPQSRLLQESDEQAMYIPIGYTKGRPRD